MTPSKRIGIVLATLMLFAGAIIVRAARVQVVQRSIWRERAARQQAEARDLPGPRGAILDETRRVLAEDQARLRLAITPREIRESDKLRRGLRRVRVPETRIARALDTSLKYVAIPGQFLPSDIAELLGLRGVHTSAVNVRSYRMSSATRHVVGAVDPGTGHGVEGIELVADSLLRGRTGASTLLHGLSGDALESPRSPGTTPVAGNTVVLTINADLQEIAEGALADAVSKMGAEGGDIVILDPNTGEIRALASRSADPRHYAATALTEPFEPGSTMKPFIAAALLDHGLVSPHDSVDTANGVVTIDGRSIHDEHRIGRAPLSEVLRWSSNIGIVKFAQRLSHREEYEVLRDFGFGEATGVDYPTESGGVLRDPEKWSRQSPASLAMGYEIAATPLQLAVAYAALANGGAVLEPTLIKEITGPDGALQYRHQPRVVRQAVPRVIADSVRRMLLNVVDEGTALSAALSNYLLAGKTGTPRATVRGRYIAGRYNPNFVGIFPGDAPQYVIVVKLTAPQRGFFSAETAAPVTRAILQAAIAARDAALDRGKLASSVETKPLQPTHVAASRRVAGSSPLQQTSASPATATDSDGGAVPYAVTLPVQRVATPASAPRRVPSVRGLTLREAVRSLHAAGFRVQLATGASEGTSPPSGVLAPPGTIVRLLYNY